MKEKNIKGGANGRNIIVKNKSINNKVLKRYVYLWEKIKKAGFKHILPFLYLTGLVVSFLLAVVSLFIPSFELCLVMFGSRLCAPVGIYTGLIISIPGYLTIGTLLSNIPNLHWFVSMSLVFAVSAFLYFLLGIFIDRFKKEDVNGRTKLILLAAFVILTYALFLLLNAK